MGCAFLSLVVLGLAPIQPAPSLISRLPMLYDAALATHPITTRVATAATLAVAGDAIAQGSEVATCVRSRASWPWKDRHYDGRRATGFVTVEALYRGLLQQRLIGLIIANFQGNLVIGLAPWANREAAAALEQTLVNQFVVAPWVYYPLFFSITSAVQGLTLQQCLRRARGQLPALFGLNLLFWFPVQLVQFSLVPLRYKVPFICLASVIWNIIISAIAGSVARWRSIPSPQWVGGKRSGRRSLTHTHGASAAARAAPTCGAEVASVIESNQ